MGRLPPLDTLRVFEAAARHLSFKEAGDELAVTASAVSHRIAALEAEVGTPLFVRHTRRLELTAEGEHLAAGMHRALLEIGRSVAAIDRRQTTKLRISAMPSHVTRWLAPRLYRFRRAFPEIELNISAELGVVDLTRRTHDIALRFGPGGYPGLHCEWLMGDFVFPVASPRYVAEAGVPLSPADLLRMTRIVDTTAENDDSGVNWRTYFEQVGLNAPHQDLSMQFTGAAITLNAAEGGLGVAMARASLVAEELRGGRLMRVLPHEFEARWAHYAVMLPERVDWPPLAAFVDWIVGEAAAFAGDRERSTV